MALGRVWGAILGSRWVQDGLKRVSRWAQEPNKKVPPPYFSRFGDMRPLGSDLVGFWVPFWGQGRLKMVARGFQDGLQSL